MATLATATPADAGCYRAECPACAQEYIGSVKIRATLERVPVVALVCAHCSTVVAPRYHLYRDGATPTFCVNGARLDAAGLRAALAELWG